METEACFIYYLFIATSQLQYGVLLFRSLPALSLVVFYRLSRYLKKIKMWRLSFFIDRISKVCVLHKLYQEFV